MPLVSIVQLNPRHVAEEISIMDGENLRRIRVEEFADCGWMKKNKVSLFFSLFFLMVAFQLCSNFYIDELLHKMK